jgi:hypothetical protein
MPEEIYEQVLRFGILDGYMFINPPQAAHEANELAQRFSCLPSLAAYASYQGVVTEDPNRAKQKINGIIYPLSDVDDVQRICLCAPGLFLSAKYTYKICQKQRPTLQVLQDDPPCQTVRGFIHKCACTY